MDAGGRCDSERFYGYLYWLCGSRAGAMELAHQAALLQPRRPLPADATLDRLRIATQLAAALPEERRRPGWLPPAHGPPPPLILASLATLSVEQRAALLLRFGLGLSDEELRRITAVAPDDALAKLAEAFDGQRDVALAELRRLAWPGPMHAEALALQSFDQAGTGRDLGSLAAARRRVALIRAGWLGVAAVIALVSWLALRDAGRRDEPAPAASPVGATPVELAAAATAPAGAPAPPATRTGPPPAVEWLLANRRPVTGSELRPAVGDARVVVIGDGTWGPSGTTEFLQERLRITRILVEEMGFEVLILQTPEPEGLIVSSFVLSSGNDEEVDAITRAVEAPWPPKAELAVFRWLHERKTVAFAGFLPSTGVFDDIAPLALQDFLEALDPENAYRLSGDRQELLDFLTAQRDVYTARDADIYHRMLTITRGLVQHDLLAEAGDDGEGGGLYEQFVRENLDRELEEAGERRVIIWASDLAASGMPAVARVIAQLPSPPERPVVRVGFLFGEGSLTALGAAQAEVAPAMQVHRVVRAPAGAYEESFAAATAGQGSFLVDVRPLSEQGLDWGGAAPLLRYNTGSYDECFPEDYFEPASLAAKYDLVIYMDRITAATLMDGVRKARTSCVHAPQNLDFSRASVAWKGDRQAAGQYAAGVSTEDAAGFVQAVCESPRGAGILYQSFRADGYVGRTIRLSGQCSLNSASGEAWLFIEARGAGGLLAAARAPRAAAPEAGDFGPCEVQLAVPEQATRIDIGLRLVGPGNVLVRGLAFRAEG